MGAVIAAFNRQIKKLKAAAKAAAEITRDDICAKIRAGIDIEGNAQQDNSETTIRSKGYKVPLVDTGRLSNPDSYKVQQTQYGAILKVPQDRIDVVRKLVEERGYGEVWGISTEAQQAIILKTAEIIKGQS